jgi:hypothetical protein
MRFRLSQAYIAWHHLGFEKLPLRPTCWCCLVIALLVLTAGCKGNRSVEHADVTGKVLFRGKPLPGGRLTFVTVQGAFAITGTIDETGNYSIKAPVGEVQISVDNRMLQSKVTTRHLKRPGAEETPIKGTFVRIPTRYAAPDSSGLNYTVKPGPQTHDIELNNDPDPVPGPPGT